MAKSRKLLLGMSIALMLAVLISVVFAETEAKPQRPQRGQGNRQGKRGQRGDRAEFMARMQQRMMENIKTELKALDDEWKVIEPRVAKVMELQRGNMFSGMRRLMGHGGRGGEGQRPEGREQTAVEKATEELEKVLDNSESSPDTIKTKLTALRKAREKAKQNMAKAQAELKSVLTLRQEGTLVMLGMLE